jgi:hypothetical protein
MCRKMMAEPISGAPERRQDVTRSPVPGRALTVLGMHRSGTSMLIGTLEEAGVYLGDVIGDSIEYNRKGLLEPKAVLYMQEDLLNVNGGSWRNPPDKIEWKTLHLAVRDLFIESRAQHAVWGFKDPRTLFTVEGWQSVLPSLEKIGIFRHPLEVAASLLHRNKLSLEQGLDLWKKYNKRLLALHAADPFPVIEFRQSADHSRRELSRLLETLRLPKALQPSELTFFEEGIRQHAAADTQLPPDVETVYCRLQDIAL